MQQQCRFADKFTTKKYRLQTAYSVLPDRFEDGRHTAIEQGLAAAGYRVVRSDRCDRRDNKPAAGVRPDDVLVTWTVHRGVKENRARAFEEVGGRVIVAEEAYIRHVPGIADQFFALSLHDHNGAGSFHDGGHSRWDSWGLKLKPWRTSGTHIVVREQRGIGSTLMASPPNWHNDTANRLRAITKRPVVTRTHPKTLKRKGAYTPPESVLADAWCVVTWASALGVKALMEGIPVIALAPHWIAAGATGATGAAGRSLSEIEQPPMPDRLPVFRRLAWAQWSMKEIADGTAFVHLLQEVRSQKSEVRSQKTEVRCQITNIVLVPDL